MKIFQLDIPEELRHVYEAVALTDEGQIILVFKEERGPLLIGRQLRIDTFAPGGAIGMPEWRGDDAEKK